MSVLLVVSDGVASFSVERDVASGEVHLPRSWPENRELDENEISGLKVLVGNERQVELSLSIESVSGHGDGIGVGVLLVWVSGSIPCPGGIQLVVVAFIAYIDCLGSTSDGSSENLQPCSRHDTLSCWIFD